MSFKSEIIEMVKTKCKAKVMNAVIENLDFNEIAEKISEGLDINIICDNLDINESDVANAIDNSDIIGNIMDNDYLNKNDIAREVSDGLDISLVVKKINEQIYDDIVEALLQED